MNFLSVTNNLRNWQKEPSCLCKDNIKHEVFMLEKLCRKYNKAHVERVSFILVGVGEH
jgi:hypothetical protein